MICGEACRADIPVSILYKETEAGEEWLASKTFTEWHASKAFTAACKFP